MVIKPQLAASYYSVCVFNTVSVPSSVPSSPMIIFIEEIICWVTGGDIEPAYAALWDVERMWLMIS